MDRIKIALHTNVDLEPVNNSTMLEWSEDFEIMQRIPNKGDRIKLHNVEMMVATIRWTKPGKWNDPVVKVELCLPPYMTLPRFHKIQKRD